MICFIHPLISLQNVVLLERLLLLCELPLNIETLTTPKRTQKSSESHIPVARRDISTLRFVTALPSYTSQGERRYWIGRLKRNLGSATSASGDRASQLPVLIKVPFCGPASGDPPQWVHKNCELGHGTQETKHSTYWADKQGKIKKENKNLWSHTDTSLSSF